MSGTISTQPRHSPLPLSFAQQRLWFLAQLEPESTGYLMSSAFHLRGPLQLSALEAGLRILAQRHEVLRTTFVMEQDVPKQVLGSEMQWAFPVVDLQSLATSEQDQEVDCILNKEANQPFVLPVGPLFRFIILKLGAEEHVFQLTLHHIISDGWSMEVFFRELNTAYTALIAKTLPSFPALSIQYADYAVWQRNYLQGDQLQRQLAYWREQLQPSVPPLSLPTDYPRPAIHTSRGARIPFTLPPSITEGLRVISQKTQSSLFMTLLAAFQILLQRLSGQDDVCVGIPSAGRTRLEIESVMGFFINTLVIRTNLADTPRFEDFLAQVRRNCLDAYIHQDVPFEKLVEVLQPARDLSRTPFFQVFFNMIPGETTPWTLPGLNVTSISKETPNSIFDLTVYLQEDKEQLFGSMVYNVELFRVERIEVLVAQYQQLLENIVASPDQLVHRYSLVPTESPSFLPDPHQSLDIPTFDSVPAHFRTWAMRTPDQVAVRHGSLTLRYADLLSGSEACARALRQQGLLQGDVIAIRGARSIGLITAMLGGWLAGGVVMPLDPNLPDSRQTLMRQIASAPFFIEIGTQLTQDRVTDVPPFSWLVIEPSTGVITSFSPVRDEEEHALPPIVEEGPAYVFFTSGTTGVPKGILGSHQALAHFLNWEREAFAISPQDRVAHFSGVSFDVMLRDLFLPLTSGATVCLPPEQTDGHVLFAWMAGEQITVVHLVPSITRSWLASVSQPICLGTLRWVFFAGEPLTAQLLERWDTACPGPTQFVNLYGPTETTLAKSWYQIPVDRIEGIQPIGRPLPQVQLLVLGDDCRLCGIGEVGEIVIRTPFRSLGYLSPSPDLPQLFRPNPYGDSPSNALYYTGDLGRYRLDGTVDILGRCDDQVKIFGVRVEPEEIAAVLGTCPAVQQCTVLGHPDLKGEMALTAYVVAHPNTSWSGHDLRAFLNARLPHTFVPFHFIFLDRLPLTPNGKIDREALRNLSTAEVTKECYVAPRTSFEETLVTIWQDVLGLEQIGIHDNFFGLGGHSLLTTQVISRVRAFTHTDLPIRILFDYPTIAKLASKLKGLRLQPDEDPISPLRSQNHDPPIPLSFAQQRLWFLDQWNPNSSLYNVASVFRLRGQLQVDALQNALRALVGRHKTLRTTFHVVDDQPYQCIHPLEEWTSPTLSILKLPNEDLADTLIRMITEETQRPFDVTDGPLYRAQLLTATETDTVFLLTLHHIITDGWSMEIFLKELSVLYAAEITGTPATLPTLPLHYADYAVWQRNWLQGEVLASQVTYWQEQLQGAPVTLTLPTDFSRPPVPSYRGARQRVVVSESLTQKLKALSQQEGVTMFMAGLAVFQVLLARYTGERDIVVGSPIANRTRQEIEGLIGFFVNTLVLRTRLTNTLSFRQLLHQVRSTCLEAYRHQDLPFEKLVEVLQPERDVSRHPLFQVMFQLDMEASQTLHFRGITSERMTVPSTIAKFDLSLALVEKNTALEGTFEYCTDLFADQTITRLIGHFHTLLEGLVAEPDQAVFSIPLLTASEHHQIVVDWNATTMPYPAESCLPELFESQVTRTPDAIAVVYGDEQLTYGQLNQRANQLAHYLQRQGVGLETRVGVYIDRRVDLIVSLLAILKTGGAYVPLDPTTPRERLDYLIQDAAVGLVLTMGELGRMLLSSERVAVLNLTNLTSELAQKTVNSPEVPFSSQQLAYIIFTSGSTGRPKGVQVSHRNVVNLVQWHQYTFGLTQHDRTTQLANLAFDAAGWEIWPTLLAGGCLVFPESEDLRLAPDRLRDWLIREGISISFLPTPLAESILALPWPAKVPLRIMLTGGDALHQYPPPGLPFTLVNNYGPTENSVVTSSGTVSPLPSRSGLAPPIGRPITNTQGFVVDPAQQLVPVGVYGELLVGGEGLAWGYLNQPALTAEKFIPHPFNGDPGARVYRSGDQVRWRDIGVLEFQGRQDTQIQLRGYRIDLREIEVVLRDHSAVTEAVVVCREEKTRGRQLVAYVVGITTVRELRSYLQGRLPEYMIPTAFVVLDTLPLTSNGKVDKGALPSPKLGDRIQGIVYAAPTTEIEELLVQLWQEVLKMDRIGIHDNFFELGGHSLLATQVIARLRQGLEIAIPLRTLFERPTVEELAKEITILLDSTFPDRPTNAP